MTLQYLVLRSCFLYCSSKKTNKGPLERWQILGGGGQEIYKMSLEHFIVPENKEIQPNK